MYTRASNRSESTESKTTQPNGPPHFDPNRTALTPSRRAWRWILAIFPSHPPRTTTLNGLSAAIFFRRQEDSEEEERMETVRIAMPTRTEEEETTPSAGGSSSSTHPSSYPRPVPLPVPMVPVPPMTMAEAMHPLYCCKASDRNRSEATPVGASPPAPSLPPRSISTYGTVSRSCTERRTQNAVRDGDSTPSL